MSVLDQFKDQFKAHFNAIQEPEHRLAWAVAIAADVLQIGAFPMFIEGAISPADSLLDLIVGFAMIRLLGWHWAFLPTAAAKLIPGADLFPTWTAAVWFVTRRQIKAAPDSTKTSQEPEILPPGPAPAPRR
ncbi:MAG TPA: hypothetical protein VKR59_13260 [Terriglobales bacterium]|nr:hypothetical protein [Terriglobales bacterium]